MIERQFVAQRTKEYFIKKYIEARLQGVGISKIKLKKIPLGEKIVISTSRPSLIVGSKGANIRELTRVLKTEFKLENPQIEINEVKDIFLDAATVAQRIASSLERFGAARFKSIGHKIMENVINSGALGVELIISGKIPSARAKSWRFYQGYLKKCGDIAMNGVRKAQTAALLKSGIVGIKVAIMPPDVILPDRVEIVSQMQTIVKDISRDKEEGDKSIEESKGEERTKKKAASKRKAAPRKKKVEQTADFPAEEQKSVPPVESSPELNTEDQVPVKEDKDEQ